MTDYSYILDDDTLSLRDSPDIVPETRDELEQVLELVSERINKSDIDDYELFVACTALATEATFNYFSKLLGLAGAPSAASKGLLVKRLCHLNYGFKLLNFEDLLLKTEAGEFAGVEIPRKDVLHLRNKALDMLDDIGPYLHPEMREHLVRISYGQFPPGVKVENLFPSY